MRCTGKEKASRQGGWMGQSDLRKCKRKKNGVCQNEKNKHKKHEEEIIKNPSPGRRLVTPAEVKHG